MIKDSIGVYTIQASGPAKIKLKKDPNITQLLHSKKVLEVVCSSLKVVFSASRTTVYTNGIMKQLNILCDCGVLDPRRQAILRETLAEHDQFLILSGWDLLTLIRVASFQVEILIYWMHYKP